MVRKIKPESAHKGTESCYFSLSPPLRPLRFSETLFRKFKKSPGFWSPQREMSETRKSSHEAQRQYELITLVLVACMRRSQCDA